ncbi:TetR/AcrR family transcriptional regulator [Laceyella tengchongensis]|jgi:AcrR family transcriptional regulator|uniref:TetR/AcrR family transcriptional regulator n=1 Tax=Laceyella tengchongensis TaxID=574699 RepID=UPI0012B705E0|nr:TetR family transcriptional regulator [Laceyella tengchongensis]
MRRKHIDSKRDEIVQAAERLFALKGISETSVRDIGKEAGVTDSAIYKHFSSKDELIKELLTQYLIRYAELIDRIGAEPLSFRERFDQLLLAIIDQHDANPFGLLLLGERYLYLASTLQDKRLPLHAMSDFLDSGIKSGELPPQDVKLTSTLFFGAVLNLIRINQIGLVHPKSPADYLQEIRSRFYGLLGLRM